MDLLVKIVIDFKLETSFAKRSEFASDYNKSNDFCKQQNITVFWNVGYYYLAGILPAQSQQ